MAANKELVHYIQESLKDGDGEAKIRKDLLAHGWNKGDIDAGFVQVEGGSNVAPVAPNTSVHYKVLEAAKDAYASIRNNLRAYLIIVVITIVVLMAMSIGFAALGASYKAGSLSFGLFMILVLVWVVALIAFQSVASGAMMLAVNDGADGKTSDVQATFKSAFSKIKRLFLTNVLLAVVLVGPFFVIFMIASLQTVLSNGGQNVTGPDFGGNIFTALLVIASFVWALFGSLRYFLAPYIALFEPDVPVTKTLARSHELVAGGGQVFMLKLIGLTLLTVIIVSAIFGGGQSGQTADALRGESQNPFVNFLTSLISLFVSAVIVLLYRNRKAIKK